MTVAVPGLRYLVPDTICPECRRRPRLSVPAESLSVLARLPPDTVLLMYRCHVWRQGKRCDEFYPITAGALQRAS
jgi:hypothetical protein